MKEEQPLDDKEHSLLLEDLYGIVQELLVGNSTTQEGDRRFWLICLNKHHQLLLVEQLNSHQLEEIYATEVFQIALHKHAVSVLLCQVNTSPSLEVSEEECQLVRQLLRVGYLIKLPIVDYLVMSTKGFLSLRQRGIFDDMGRDKKPPLTIEQAKQLAQEAVEEAKNTLEDSYYYVYNELEKTALSLYDEGLSIERIMHLTGLSEISLQTLIEQRK